jgi:hypothetical protein
LVYAFLKKWWVESDFKAPNLQLSLAVNVNKNQCNETELDSYAKQRNKSELSSYA